MERRGYSQLNEEALDRTAWRARFGRGFGPVVRQSTKLMTQLARTVIIIVDIAHVLHIVFYHSIMFT